MSKTKKIIVILALVLIPLGVVSVYAMTRVNASKSGSVDSGGGEAAIVIDWKKLRELDLQTGTPSQDLSAANGKSVKIPGFMVPLEDNQSDVTEFLLVPSPQACIHVPPPPANQMVHVKMGDGTKAKMAWGPVWVEGRFHISDATSIYGKASYQIIGRSIEPYRYQ